MMRIVTKAAHVSDDTNRDIKAMAQCLITKLPAYGFTGPDRWMRHALNAAIGIRGPDFDAFMAECGVAAGAWHAETAGAAS